MKSKNKMTGKINIRVFNVNGLHKFKKMHQNAYANKTKLEIDPGFLFDHEFTDVFEPYIDIDLSKVFEDRLQFAEYISTCIDSVWDFTFDNNVGFWTWIASRIH